MKKRILISAAFAVLMFWVTASIYGQQTFELRIDPLLVVSLKECRNISNDLANELFPGWDFQKPLFFSTDPMFKMCLSTFLTSQKDFQNTKVSIHSMAKRSITEMTRLISASMIKIHQVKLIAFLYWLLQILIPQCVIDYGMCLDA